MTTWILILFAHAGPWSDKDSNSMTSVSGFTSQAICQQAGEQAKEMAKGTTKLIKYSCVKTGA